MGEALAAAFTLHVADLFYRGCFMTGSWLGHGCVTASLANDGVFEALEAVFQAFDLRANKVFEVGDAVV